MNLNIELARESAKHLMKEHLGLSAFKPFQMIKQEPCGMIHIDDCKVHKRQHSQGLFADSRKDVFKETQRTRFGDAAVRCCL